MNYQKQIEALIWWHNESDSSQIWSQHDGFNLTFENRKETVLLKNVTELFKNIQCSKIVGNLEEDARQSAIRWQFLKDELWNLNYDHEQSCNEPVVLYKSRMQRFELNLIWSRIIRECAIQRKFEIEKTCDT